MRTSSGVRILFLVVSLVVAAVVLVALANTSSVRASTYPRLVCGTDNFAFNGLSEELAAVHTNGPTVVGGVEIFDIQFPVNGLAPASGYIMSGQPEDVESEGGTTLRVLGDFGPPHVILTVSPGSNSFSADCCNEQMVQAPDGKFYHAHYSDSIQQLVLQGGQSQVVNTFPQSDVVGMASDGVNIWITNWSAQQVGTWDPTTNIFTPVFTTPGDAGGLAWDIPNGVLWVGMSGGAVIPYNASGQQLGPGFSPFGSISGPVDGLAFVP
jgi:hypothetical protein